MRERPVVLLRRLAGLVEEVEIVVLRPARADRRGAPGRFFGLRQRNRDAEILPLRRLVDLVPDLRVVALDDLLQRERARLAAGGHRVRLPRHRRLDAERGPAPYHVEMRELAGRLQAEADLADAEFVAQPVDEVG